MDARYTQTAESLVPFVGTGAVSIAHVRLYEAPGAPPVALVGRLRDIHGPFLDICIEQVTGLIQRDLIGDARQFRLIVWFPYTGVMLTRAHPDFQEVTFARRVRRRWLGRTLEAARARRARRPGGYRGLAVVDQDGAARYQLPPELPEPTLPWTFHGPEWGQFLQVQWPDDTQALDLPDPANLFDPRQSDKRVVRAGEALLPALLGGTRFTVWPTDHYTTEVVGGLDALPLAAWAAELNERSDTMRVGFIRAILDAPAGAILEPTDPA